MTLGIGFATPNYAGVITDRRLTSTKAGKPKVGDTTKCGTVDFVNARLCYTFTGLASVGTLTTTRWMAEQLCESGRGGASFQESLERFSVALSAWMAGLHRVSKTDKRLSIVFAGFVVSASASGQDLPSIILVSNFENLTGHASVEAAEQFSVHTSINPHGASQVRLVGSASFNDGDVETFLDRIDKAPPEGVLAAGLQIIHNASAKDPFVGRSASSVVIGHQRGQGGMATNFFPDAPAEVIPVPAYVRAIYGNEGAYIILEAQSAATSPGGAALIQSVPRVHKNAPCPCNLGRKYKSCHGRARGAPHASTPAGTMAAGTLDLQFKAFPDDGPDMPILAMGEDMKLHFGALRLNT